MRADEAKEKAIRSARYWLGTEYLEIDQAINEAANNGRSYVTIEGIESKPRLLELVGTLGYGVHQHGSENFSITF